jgi:hypothetical protein
VTPHRALRSFPLVVAGLLLVFVLLGFSFLSITVSTHARARIDHTVRVKTGLWHALQLLTDAETAQRGYPCSSGVLASLVANLVDNALKYIGDGPR